MGHEVEARHEEDEVDEEDPVFAEGVFAFLHEEFGGIGLFFADPFAFEIGLCFWEAQAEDDD